MWTYEVLDRSAGFVTVKLYRGGIHVGTVSGMTLALWIDFIETDQVHSRGVDRVEVRLNDRARDCARPTESKEL